MLARGLKKFICRLIALALIVCIIAAVFYGYKGYEMYKEAVSKTPISSIYVQGSISQNMKACRRFI